MSSNGNLKSSISHNTDSRLDYVNELVKSWNHRSKVSTTCDRENYINGDIKFLFEYAGRGNFQLPTLLSVYGRDVPTYVSMVLAEVAIDQTGRKIRNLFSDNITGKPCIISGWDQKLVLVDDVELVEEREKFVPTRLTVGFQVENGLIEGWGDPIGESLLYSFIKPCLGFAKGELQKLPFIFSGGERRNDVPISVVESGAEVVNNISANKCGSIYNRFISFCKSGALSDLCICFENIGERTSFIEQYVQLVDVFRGPINL